MATERLSAEDRFLIFEQMNLHQRYIDNDASAASAEKYVQLYWPDARMVVHYATLQNATFDGPAGLKQVYDYAHSVFPIHRMRHSVGAFVIDGTDDRATAEWHWVVKWREGASGVLS